MNLTAYLGRLVVDVVLLTVLHQRVQLGENPAVDFGTFCERNLRLFVRESVNIGVQREKVVGVEQRAEEFALHFADAGLVELEVVPRGGVGDHVPAGRVGTVFVDDLERIDSVAQTFGHLVAVFVEHQAIGNHRLESHAVEQHRGDGVQREEPAAGLIHTLCDEVGGEVGLEELLVLERVVQLAVRHRAGVEPDIDEVALAVHLLTRRGDQHDGIDVGFVQVDVVVVVLLRHIVDLEVLIRIFGHKAGGDGLVDFGHQLLDGTDADLLFLVLGGPDGQRHAPEAGAGEVPIDEVLEPVAETTGAGGGRLPLDGLVQLHHTLFVGGRLDEPGVERIVEHGLVGAPAVRVVVGVLLALEKLALLLQHHHDIDVQGFVLLGFGRVVGVLHELAGVGAVGLHVHAVLDKFGVEVLDAVELAGAIDHRLADAVLVDHHERRDAGGGGHALIVGAEGRSDVHDAGTVFRGDIVAGDDAEGTLAGVHPRDELLVGDAHEIFALELLHNLRGFLEHRGNQRFGHQDVAGLFVVRMHGLQHHIVDVRTHAQRRVARQRPRGGRPRNRVHRNVRVRLNC